MARYFFQFQHPYFFLLLLFLPLIYFWYWRRSGVASIGFSSVNLLSDLPRSLKEKLKFIVPALRVAALILLIFAVARPQFGSEISESLTEGIDIFLTIDTSGSMKALDFHLQNSEANRLDVVKSVVDKFISRRTHDRIGMVIFGEKAYTQCPLTYDQNALKMFLQWIRIGIVGDGTAVGNALATSVKRLKDQKTKSKIIILLTDGRNNAGEITPLTAAGIAKEFNIRVYTIGVGSSGPVPYLEETGFGTRRVYARLDLDEDTLKEIADITGGLYFRATETKELEKIYKTIDELEKTEVKVKEYHDYKELYLWFLIPGLFFLILGILLSETYFQRIP